MCPMTVMKMFVAAVGTGLLLFVQGIAPQATAKVLRFGHLWDGTGLMDSVSVVIEGTKITSVGGRVTVPSGAEDIDLTKYTAIPGLIDLHTHVTYYWDHAPGTTPLRQGG